jgi:Glycosyl transferase family 2
LIEGEYMQLSILLPTHRSGLLACSRIAQACSWAAPNIEVIIRDNSGDSKKRELLTQFDRDHCNIILADPCDPGTNFSEALRLAKGEFVFFLADDDFCFDHAIASLSAIIERFEKDPSVVGITGAYVAEASQGSSILSYQNVEAGDVATRVTGFLSYCGPNVLYYSPVRREIVQRVFAFMNAMPCTFSFHDQIICLLYLLNGKFIKLNRLLYLYDTGVWEKPESAQKLDVDFYLQSGLDPAINVVHWFLCGFEGAVLVRNANLFPDHSLAQRQVVADLWFSAMFRRFQSSTRLTFGSGFVGQAEKLRAKLLLTTGRLLFQDQLEEICNFIALFSQDKAKSYRDFWDAVINRREPALDGAAFQVANAISQTNANMSLAK